MCVHIVLLIYCTKKSFKNKMFAYNIHWDFAVQNHIYFNNILVFNPAS